MESLVQAPAPACYVDPDEPGKSVFDPSFSWWQLLLQGGLGLWLALYSGWQVRKLFRRQG